MIKILITGDFCPLQRIEKLIEEDNYNLIFNDFLEIIKKSDFSITNLECPLILNGVPIEKTGPHLKALPKSIKALKFAGFSLVTLANNHIMDYGLEGLNNTIDLCNENEINYVGVGNDKNDARKIYYTKIKGKSFAIINVAENEFSNASDNSPGANPLSLIKNYYDIKEAKKNAEFVIVIFHGGNEMHQLPSPRVKEILRFFADSGANAVIGHHTHCFSSYEVYNDIPIFYSLGNFIFDYKNLQENKLWNRSYCIILKIMESGCDFEIVPYIQNTIEKVGVHLMKGTELEIFKSDLTKFNNILQDDYKLSKEFEEMIIARKNQYLNYIEPFSNKVLVSLRNKKLIPSMLNKKKKLLLLNLIRCEAHRDILLKLLKNN